jgi:tetratricopeptide (TPR) repeat protein
LDEPSDETLLLAVLNGFWLASYVAFNGDAMRELAARFLALAEQHGAIASLILGHRLMGVSLMRTGDIAEGRTHFDRGIALYDRAAQHPLATRSGKDFVVYAISSPATLLLADRSMALWILGYPEAALTDAQQVIKDVRDLGRVVTYAVGIISRVLVASGNYAAANALLDEAIAWTDERGAVFWKAMATALKGCVFAMTGKPSDAVQLITSGMAAWRSTGATAGMSVFLIHLTTAYADDGQFDDAWRCVHEATVAIKTTKETIYEAEVNRVAGEIALKSPVPDAVKAQEYFERALAVAKAQQAKSWELRAAMSLARLWRDQGKVQQAHELLAPVYGWFTEGFDTRDLKEAKVLLEELGENLC